MTPSVRIQPIPHCPVSVGIHQLVRTYADDLGPATPVGTQGSRHIVRPVALVDGGVALEAKVVLPEGVASLCQQHRYIRAPVFGQSLQLEKVAIDGQIRV